MHQVWKYRSEIAGLEAHLKKLKKEYGLPIADGARKRMLKTAIQMTEAKLVEIRRYERLRYAYIESERALREYAAEVKGS